MTQRNPQLPPMTMVFQARDATMLDKVRVGDEVRLKVEMAGSAMVVTDIGAVN